MSRIIERFLLPLFVLMSMLYAFHSCCGGDGKTVQLTKVYHHKAGTDDAIELASLVFYFSCNPQIQMVKNNIFFFPYAIVSSAECKKMIAGINQEESQKQNQNNQHAITITYVTRPIPGIQITFNNDPEKIALAYELFDSISLQKGVVFRLYNKDLLRTLDGHSKSKPVLRTVQIQKPCIVLDPGHGGLDCGAVGLDGMLYEKNVCLAIGQQVEQLLKQDGYAVKMTRTHDNDCALDMRTVYANQCNADLFVSIHANHATNKKICGVETFCTDPHLFKEKWSVLTLGEKKYVQSLMYQRSDNAYACACSIQKNICNAIQSYYDQTSSIDRKVKHSVSQVLLGTQMPAVLVEVGFLSNPHEASLLNSHSYQNTVARAIYNGIIAYLLL